MSRLISRALNIAMLVIAAALRYDDAAAPSAAAAMPLHYAIPLMFLHYARLSVIFISRR